MSEFRPLPSMPNLEFERKEAKALLRRLRASDAYALERARARHPALASNTADIRLADAQLVIAREYGFTSWPRLVRYFGDVERQRHSQRSIQSHRANFYENSVRSLMAQHQRQRGWAARMLASYVPRFYGMRADDIFAATITEEEARLAVARQNGFPSWVVMLERIAAEPRREPAPWEVGPGPRAARAIRAGDLEALKKAIGAHPELLHPNDHSAMYGGTIPDSALEQERIVGIDAMRPIVDWLVSQGFDLQRHLNLRLCGHMRMQTDTVRWLLERGADPNWVAPNGIPVLEHALIRYWNREAVDVLAARAVPRQGLWIAAGLGDVDGVSHFLKRDGSPTAAARRIRPDFDAAGPPSMPSHPDPDDEEILLEAFMIAVLNGRANVLEYMVSRGFNVNTLYYDSPMINLAIGNGMPEVVECLIRCGADLDLKGDPNGSPREFARVVLTEVTPRTDNYRRIAELCGHDPDAILAELDARVVPPPTIAQKLQQALELASDDARRLGQSDVHPENLLFGLLRTDGIARMAFTRVSRMDLERFYADVRERVDPGDERIAGAPLPLHADAQAMLDAAIAFATKRKSETVNTPYLLNELLRSDGGAAATWLSRYGGNVAQLRTELERGMFDANG